MDRETKLDLMRRALGLRHKLKVHDSMPKPETHEQIALSDMVREELDEELVAIEQLLQEARQESIEEKRKAILRDGVKVKKLETARDE